MDCKDTNTFMWKIVQSPEFGIWFTSSDELDENAREDIVALVRVLQNIGPVLGRPYVDSVQGSRISNLKELRVQSKGRPFRIFFAFDKKQRAILLIGGNKSRDARFYKRMIPVAEEIYDNFLKRIQDGADDYMQK